MLFSYIGATFVASNRKGYTVAKYNIQIYIYIYVNEHIYIFIYVYIYICIYVHLYIVCVYYVKTARSTGKWL